MTQNRTPTIQTQRATLSFHLLGHVMPIVLDYMLPHEIVALSCTSNELNSSVKTQWMRYMSCFLVARPVPRLNRGDFPYQNSWASNRHLSDHNEEEDLFVSHFPYNQLDVSVEYGALEWRYLHFYYQYIKHIIQDIQFDQVVGARACHPIHQNTMVAVQNSPFAKGMGVCNRIMRCGSFQVTFVVNDILCTGKYFGITRPAKYLCRPPNDFAGNSSLGYQGNDEFYRPQYPEVYCDNSTVNVAMLYDYVGNGIRSMIMKGTGMGQKRRINGSRRYPLGNVKTGAIVTLILKMNDEGTDGTLHLVHPNRGKPLLIANQLSGEYVWFACTHNNDGLSAYDNHACDINILS